jgi:hypothetical protein
MAEAAASLATTRVAHKVLRVKDMQDRIEALKYIQAERAKQYGGMHPGTDTGYIAPVVTAAGRQAWALDTGLLAELRNLEQAVAKELGQIVDKHQVQSDINVNVQVDLTRLSDEELIELERITRAATVDQHALTAGDRPG